MKVQQVDLVGRIKDFPLEIVQAMVDYQEIKNISIYQKNAMATAMEGGFNWAKTEEGRDIWNRIIVDKEFHLLSACKKGDVPKKTGRPRKHYRKNVDWDEKLITMSAQVMAGIVSRGDVEDEDKMYNESIRLSKGLIRLLQQEML